MAVSYRTLLSAVGSASMLVALSLGCLSRDSLRHFSQWAVPISALRLLTFEGMKRVRFSQIDTGIMYMIDPRH